MSNRDTYCETYAKAFREIYGRIEVYGQTMQSELVETRIKQALAVACENIERVNISGAAFALTSKRLGIKHTKKAIAEYLGQNGHLTYRA